MGRGDRRPKMGSTPLDRCAGRVRQSDVLLRSFTVLQSGAFLSRTHSIRQKIALKCIVGNVKLSNYESKQNFLRSGAQIDFSPHFAARFSPKSGTARVIGAKGVAKLSHTANAQFW